jgi:bacterioferritin
VTDQLSDIPTLRANARAHINDGAVTDAHAANVDEVVKVLNEALATELVCVLRYKRHYYMSQGINSAPVAAEFLAHAVEEQEHADRIAERIVQLQGEPDFDPATLVQRSHAEYIAATDLREMITENLVAERIAIESYTEIARWIGDRDITSRRLIESILAVEEEHAEDMLSFLQQFDGSSPAL